MEGIGDTIRVSLSANPVEEVKIGYEILKSLNLRHKGVNIISCPSCARQGFPVIDTVKILEEKLSHIKEPITLSIIGCVVNGPGEASQTQIGLTGGGKGDHMMYLSGLPHHKVASDKIIEEVVSLVENKSKELKIIKLQKMIPIAKVKSIVDTYKTLEKELASGNIDKKDFVKKSKEYSSIGEVINQAKGYLSFEKEKLELEKIIEDKESEIKK